jgi:hypothetical protein
MRPTLRIALLAVTLLLPVALPAQASPASAPAARPKPAQLPADSMARARKWTFWLYTTQSDSLYAQMDSGAKAVTGSPRALDNNSAELAQRAGSETKVIEEKFITRNGNRQYWRTASFSNLAEPLLVRFVMNAKGQLMGIGMGLASTPPPIDP